MSESEDVTIKDVIRQVKIFSSEVWRRKLWVAVIALLFSAIFVTKAYLKPITYNAKLTFMINDDEQGGAASIGGILGQIGLGGAGGGKYNYDKIFALAKSNRIVEQVLFDTATIGEETDFIANHILEQYKEYDFFNKYEEFKNFKYRNDHLSEKKSRVIFKMLLLILNGLGDPSILPNLAKISYDEKSTLMLINCSTISEELSLNIANSWYNQVSKFYIEKSVERQQSTYNHLVHKADSIYRLLYGSETALAKNSETQGLVIARGYLPRVRNSRRIEMYSEMYKEIIRNKETAEFILKSETPFFQVVDQPFLPLDKSYKKYLKNAMLGLFIGSFLSIVFVIIRFFIKEAQQ